MNWLLRFPRLFWIILNFHPNSFWIILGFLFDLHRLQVLFWCRRFLASISFPGCAWHFLCLLGFLNSLHTIKISAIAAINLCPWQVKMVLHKNDPLSLVTLPFLNGFSAPEPFFCELQCQDTLQPILCEWKFVWIFVRI